MNLIWHSPGQPVRFLDFRISDGMLFATRDRNQWPGEPSAVQINASVASHSDNPINDLGYYPSYESLTPSQRRCYLEWLAGGRRDLDPSRRALGYLFLFFYGIERRICLDGDRDPALLEELIGLLQHYSPSHRSRSFRGYFLNLLHFGSWKLGQAHYRHYWPRMMDLDEGKTGEEPLKLVLANLFDLGESMHWSIAYRLAMTDDNSRRSVVVGRSQDQFWSLFEARYENAYPGGMVLKAAKQPTSFWYQPASSAMLQKVHLGNGRHSSSVSQT